MFRLLLFCSHHHADLKIQTEGNNTAAVVLADLGNYIALYTVYTRFVQKVSELTKVHEADKAYGVLTLIVFNVVPFRSYTLLPLFLPLLETFCELVFRDV